MQSLTFYSVSLSSLTIWDLHGENSHIHIHIKTNCIDTTETWYNHKRTITVLQGYVN
jgi:hypothetical protein